MEKRTWIWAAVVLVVVVLLWMGGVFGSATTPVAPSAPATVAPAAGTPPAAVTPAPEVRPSGG